MCEERRPDSQTGERAICPNTETHNDSSVCGRDKPYRCNVCDKQFFGKDTLIKHLRVHTGQKFVCAVCEMNFTTNEELGEHNIRNHSRGKPYHCTVCDKHFSRKRILTTHQRIHTRQKLFECKCGKAFAKRSHLTDHTRVHTGEKPYHCKESIDGSQ